MLRSFPALEWSGPLSGLLKTVAAHFEITWEFRHETIRFFNYESRTFTLIAPPSTSEVKSQIDSSIKGIKSDNEENSANIQGVSNSVKLDYWAKVKDTITALVPEGTKFSVSPEAGTVKAIYCREGELVGDGAVLVELS